MNKTQDGFMQGVVKKLIRLGKDASFFADGYILETLGNLHLDGMDPRPVKLQGGKALAGTYAAIDYLMILIRLTDGQYLWAIWRMNREPRRLFWEGFVHIKKEAQWNLTLSE